MRWVYASIDTPAEHAQSVQRFWSAATGWSLGETWPRHPQFRGLEPVQGDTYINFQTIEEGPSAVHFDVASDQLTADLDRLADLGAEPVAAFRDWHVMRSPGGLEFCLVETSGNVVPPSTSWPDGHRSRLVQLCIDSPPGVHDEEVAFWRTATCWRFERSHSPEFAGKLFPPQPAPIQFLLQRLGDDDSGSHTRVHIDLGAGDALEAEATRLEALGATRGEPGRGWIQMSDPSGMVFCVTANAPD
jgi:hypothetical protein